MVSAPLRSPASPIDAVVIGGSAGALNALGEILPGLPASFPAVLVVIHVLPSPHSRLAELFAPRCAMRVLEAEAFEPILPGAIYFAPADYHLLIDSRRRCALAIDAPVHFSRPAIDVLFESAAEVYGPGLVAVVLSGASDDGALGLRAVHAAGGSTIVHEPATAEVDIMPAAALAAVPAARVLSAAAILSALLALGRAS